MLFSEFMPVKAQNNVQIQDFYFKLNKVFPTVVAFLLGSIYFEDYFRTRAQYCTCFLDNGKKTGVMESVTCSPEGESNFEVKCSNWRLRNTILSSVFF